MSAISPINTSNNAAPQVSSNQPIQLSYGAFDANFGETTQRTLVPEDFHTEYEDSKPIVASGLGDCIALFVVSKDKTTQSISYCAAYHMTVDLDQEELEEFLDGFNTDTNDISLHLIGGNESSDELLKMVYTSIETIFESRNFIASETLYIVEHPNAQAEVISAALTQNGTIYWTYGMV